MTELHEDLINLASERLGAVVLAANDDFFAAKENLVRDAEPIANDEYTDRGKWMDGWETRRRRVPGHDWCVLRLGARGVIREVVIDTTHFKGNHPPQCSIDMVDLPGDALPLDDTTWEELLPPSDLAPDTQNTFPVGATVPVTHLRLNIFPDGGVARLRALGSVVPDLERLRASPEADLAAIENGGLVVLASDMFFGHRQNMIMPGKAASMRDGWETRRRRGPGHDWAIIQLGVPGKIHRLEIDTSHFKGNAPGSCSVDVLAAADAEAATLMQADWGPLLPEVRMRPDTVHTYEKELASVEGARFLRLNIFPDGGVARFRAWGTVSGAPG